MTGSGPVDAAAPSIRVVLVDDQPLVRAGISFILSTEPGIDVVSEAAKVSSRWWPSPLTVPT